MYRTGEVVGEAGAAVGEAVGAAAGGAAGATAGGAVDEAVGAERPFQVKEPNVMSMSATKLIEAGKETISYGSESRSATPTWRANCRRDIAGSPLRGGPWW